jgi:predicted metal-dependent RNase
VYSDYLSGEMNGQVNQGEKNPFQSKNFTIVESHLLDSEPAIIISPSFTMDGGPSLHYLKQLAQREENKIILTSYQMPGSIGRYIQEGRRQMSINGQEIKLHSTVEIMEGLDVHSDYGQLIGFVSRLRHKLRRVLVNHGERSRVQNLATSINRILKIPTQHPLVLEAIKLV